MNVAVIGSGTMGSGIAQVAATAGCTVKIYDTNFEAIAKSRDALGKTLMMLLEKGKSMVERAYFESHFIREHTRGFVRCRFGH
jgi:3-hydroxybutyryl-CoA dehydrogenase